MPNHHQSGLEIGLLLAGLLSGLANHAYAQDAAKPASGQLGTIAAPTITIRKAAEPASQVPASVTVYEAAQLTNQNLGSPLRQAQATPGFAFTDPFGRFNPAPAVRGLIQPGLGEEPSVASFVDGVYLSGRSSFNTLAFDAKQIEMIKGPQSSLHGRNAFGGAIAVVTNAPEFTPSYSVDSKISSGNRTELTAVANQPLNEDWALRASFYRRDWGGLFDYSVAGGPEIGPEIGSETTHAGRVALRYAPSARRDVVARFMAVGDADGQPKGFLVTANCGARLPDGALRYYCGQLPNEAASYAANPQHDGFQRLNYRGSFNWDERWSREWQSVLLLAGSDERNVFNRDDDYSPQLAARAGQATQRYDLQMDGRLHYTPADSAWSGFGGLSLYRFVNETQREDQLYVSGQTRPGGATGYNLTETIGFYGGVKRELGDGWAISGAARWQEEWKEFVSSLSVAGQPLRLADSWQSFSPSLTLTKTLPDATLFYASVARGDKSGGFNDRANIRPSERTYGPEYNWTYELGLKNLPLSQLSHAASDWQLDANVFYVDWQQQQVTAYSSAGTTQNFYLNNAGSSQSWGGELTLAYRPATNWGGSLTYALTRATFVDYNDPDLTNVTGFAPSGRVAGNDLPRYSPHQLRLGGFYGRQLPGSNWHWQLESQTSYLSRQFTDNSNQAWVGDKWLTDAQLNFSSGDGRYMLGAWVENLWDDRTALVGIPWSDATANFRRAWLVVPADGRVAGVRVRIAY